MDRIWSALSTRTVSQSRRNVASSRVSSPPARRISSPTEASRASASRAGTPAYGLVPSDSLSVLPRWEITHLVGSGVRSWTSRRSPRRWLARCRSAFSATSEADGVALVDQRRIADDPVAAAGQLAPSASMVPNTQSVAPPRVCCAAARVSVCWTLGASCSARAVEVLAHGDLAAVAGDHERHPQVAGHLLQVDRRSGRPARRSAHAAPGPAPAAATPGCRRSGRVISQPARAPGRRTPAPAPGSCGSALGSARIISVTSSEPHPRDLPGERRASSWFSTASGISTLTPSRGSPGENR